MMMLPDQNDVKDFREYLDGRDDFPAEEITDATEDDIESVEDYDMFDYLEDFGADWGDIFG